MLVHLVIGVRSCLRLVVGVRSCVRLVVGMYVLVFDFWWARNLPFTGYVEAIGGAISGAELILMFYIICISCVRMLVYFDLRVPSIAQFFLHWRTLRCRWNEFQDFSVFLFVFSFCFSTVAKVKF